MKGDRILGYLDMQTLKFHATKPDAPASLKGMTHEVWQALTENDRTALRDLGCLNPQLTGLEGWRVEVERMNGEKARFIVSRSTGWVPVHIELSRRTSTGGIQADREYKSVRKLYQAREQRGAYWMATR